MKNLILILLFLIIGNLIFANCPFGGFQAYPKGKFISNSSQIIIEGHTMISLVILELNKKYPIYLKSENQKIRLQVIETFKGKKGVIQSILKPSKSLRIGAKYTLSIDNYQSDNINVFKNWNPDSHRYEEVVWTVVDYSDDIPPRIIGRPLLLDKYIIPFGCGDAQIVEFEINVEDDSKTFVRAELVNLQTNESTVFNVPIKDGKINIGCGMCSGGFYYNRKGCYKTRFKVFDEFGNIMRGWSSWIEFETPYKLVCYETKNYRG